MKNSFADLISSISSTGSFTSTVTIPDVWLQGRTTYGGLSAALCLESVQKDYPDLPLLRSAQVNFIGPAGGEVSITNKVLRRGKSVAFISSEMYGEKGLATHVVFCFGASRGSKLDSAFTAPPVVPSLEESKSFFKSGLAPAFTQHFECMLAKGDRSVSGSKESELYLWVRYKESQLNNMVTLLSIADIPPPAVLPMFKEPAPISSMTWMVNFLSGSAKTTDGWWLLRTTAENVKEGYSSQDMAMWNSDKELVLTGKQSVAIFY